MATILTAGGDVIRPPFADEAITILVHSHMGYTIFQGPPHIRKLSQNHAFGARCFFFLRLGVDTFVIGGISAVVCGAR